MNQLYDLSKVYMEQIASVDESATGGYRIEEGLRSAVKRLLGGGKKEAEAPKPESRGDQLRKKYNVGPEKSDTSAKRQILDRSRARAKKDEKDYGDKPFQKQVAQKSKAAHDRYLKAGYSKYGADDARGSGNKARKRAAALNREEFEFIVNALIEEGYDLSSYTWDEMYEVCLDEAVKGQDTEVRKAASAERRAGDTLTKKLPPYKGKEFGKYQGDQISYIDKKTKGKFIPGMATNEALDPVGQEDADIDNDGKKNTKSDKYLTNRRKVRGVAIRKESFSNWRQDLSEVMDTVDAPDDEYQKQIKEKKIQNKIKINPDFKEAVEEIGGQLIEMIEVEEGYQEIDREKETKMYRRAGNLARTSLSSKGKEKEDARNKSAKIVSAITRQKENERFNRIGQSPAHNEEFEIDEAEGSYGQTPKASAAYGSLANKRRNTPASEYPQRGAKKVAVKSAERHMSRSENPDAGNRGKQSTKPHWTSDSRKGMTQKDRNWRRGADEYGHSGYDGEGGGGSLPKGKKLERQKKTGVSAESFDYVNIELDEKTLTSAETAKKEEIVKSMKKSLSGFKSRYGKDAKSVMYATATKQAKKLREAIADQASLSPQELQKQRQKATLDTQIATLRKQSLSRAEKPAVTQEGTVDDALAMVRASVAKKHGAASIVGSPENKAAQAAQKPSQQPKRKLSSYSIPGAPKEKSYND